MENTNEIDFLEKQRNIGLFLNNKKNTNTLIENEYKETGLLNVDLQNSQYFDISTEQDLMEINVLSKQTIEEFDLLNYDYSSFK